MGDDGEEVESLPTSVRRTLTLRNTAARQVAVNFLPSRQLPFSTLRGHSSPEELTERDGDPAERQADLIVREMEQHPKLMQDAPDADELRREALRDLPQGLTMKRTVRAKLSASVSLRSKRRPISYLKRIKYQLSFNFKRFKERLRDFFFSIELWYEALRNIEGQFGSAVGSYFRFLRWMFVADLVLAVFLVCLVVVPQSLYDASRNETVSRGFMDFVSGKGSFEDSLLFYGHYHDSYISRTVSERYYMPFAYFFTMACLYLAFFGVLCYKTAYSYRHNFIAAGGAGSQPLANKLFCGWDFSIVSHHAASLHATSLFNEFKEILTEKNRSHTEESFLTKLAQKMTNIMLTVFVIGLIAGLEYSFWLLLSYKTSLPYWELLVSFVITTAVALFPILFGFIVRLEFYSVRTSLYVTLARTWLLDMGTMMMLLVYWTKSDQQCWETRFGQETYRLVLLDAVVSLFLLPALEFLRSYVFKFDPSTSPPEFNIAYNSLTIIYNQVLLWLGMAFSPLLGVVVTIKLLLLFYVKRFCATHACQPARKVWRGAQTQTVLYMLVTLSLFATLFGLGSLFLGVSSHSCGPFRQYDYVYSVVSEGVLNLTGNHILNYCIHFVTRPGVIALVGLLLGVTVYYVRARALAQISMVEILRNMLVLQAKDKDFLLNAIAKVSNGEWMYSPRRDDEVGPQSHTWKYLKEVRKPSNADFHFDASRLSHSYNERPRSYVKENRPNSYYPEKSNEDGDTDSSFSWQGSSNYLNKEPEVGDKKLT